MKDSKDLLVEAMAQIEMEPGSWVQKFWLSRCENFLPEDNLCGTAGCLAGWVTILDADYLTEHGWVIDYTHQVLSNKQGDTMSIGVYAADRLGLDQESAEALFFEDNTMDDLRVGVKAVLNGQDVTEAIAQWNEQLP